MKWEYPLWKDKGGVDKTTTSKWRVYTLRKKKSLANNDLIASMCLINQSYILELFDCVSTNSFISSKSVRCLGLELSPLNPHMLVTTTNDGYVIEELVCENCLLTVSDKTYYITSFACLSKN